MLVPVPDLADPRLSDYRDLTDVALRVRTEEPAGLYMAESTTVITRAIEAGHRPRSVLTAPRWLDDLAPVLETATGAPDGGEVPVFVAEEPLLREIVGFRLHRGAIAAMHRPVPPPLSEILEPADRPAPRRIAVLEDIVDHTNVGAVVRSAAALGVDAVLVTPSCADPLYRRAVRVSMGTIFQVPWTRLPTWPHGPGGVGALREAGFTVAAASLSERSIALDELAAEPPERLAIVLGSEGHGLKPATMRAVDLEVVIPMSGGVDSLNVAASSAVLFWATRVR
ncbi:TrmH family RNA methyltransferase [Georgenia sp. Z1344]|uniref:TrmH family RNA methyltransferase n=1 Tax=Georgenia sp. Z1344 TaxID=3416706 RepID=UPI003CED940A